MADLLVIYAVLHRRVWFSWSVDGSVGRLIVSCNSIAEKDLYCSSIDIPLFVSSMFVASCRAGSCILMALSVLRTSKLKQAQASDHYSRNLRKWTPKN